MDIKSLELFIDVAETGSFANAARKHDRDPSQVSRTIAAMETQLRFQLFKRSTRKLSLTEAGERYLNRVRHVIDELDFAVEEARQLVQIPSGKLRITASTSFGQICLLPLLPEFYKRHPEIELDLQLTDKNLDLITEDIDLACRLAPGFQSDLIGVKLFDTQYSICASPSYIESHAPIKSPSDISEHDCVVLDLPSYKNRWQFLNANKSIEEVKIRSRICVSNALALKECLLYGMGPGLAADWLVKDEIQNGKLVKLFPDLRVSATDFSTAAWLLYASRKYLPSKTRAMIDYLKEQFLIR